MNYWASLQNDEDHAMLEQGAVALQRTVLSGMRMGGESEEKML